MTLFSLIIYGDQTIQKNRVINKKKHLIKQSKQIVHSIVSKGFLFIYSFFMVLKYFSSSLEEIEKRLCMDVL